MAKKENKGGLLTNEQVERDNKVKGKTTEGGHYQGSQDTGDSKVKLTGKENADSLKDKEKE